MNFFSHLISLFFLQKKILDNRKKLRKQVRTYMAHTAWKKVCIRSFLGLHFPTIGLNTERYFVCLRIHFECGKIQTWKTANKYTFHVVSHDTVTKGSSRVNNGWCQPGTNIWNTKKPIYCPSISTISCDIFLNPGFIFGLANHTCSSISFTQKIAIR